MRYLLLACLFAVIVAVICLRSYLDSATVNAVVVASGLAGIIVAFTIVLDWRSPKTGRPLSPQNVDEVPSEVTARTSDVASQSKAGDFLQMIAGPWHLVYERKGTEHPEDCIIDENGNYYLQGNRRRVYAKLENVDYNPGVGRVQFLKRQLRRPRSQVEILKINDDCTEMVGHAEHDGHSLKYTRPADQATDMYARPRRGEIQPAKDGQSE